MDMQTQIEQHEKEIVKLKAQIARCQHDFGDPYSDIDEKTVPVQENRPMGSDYFNPVTVGFRIEQTQVWRRKCKKCGFKQTTTETEPVIQSRRPVFR